MKVVTIVGTRPEVIKLSRVIAKLDQFTKHILVHTGQNFDYELNKIFFDDLNIRKPDYFLDVAGNSAINTIANVIVNIDEVLKKELPDALLLLGDTNSCLAVITAKKRKIPIFHMEAGNRCYDQRVPEEVNRKIVDHMSDINLPYSDIAREYLLKEGIPAEQVIKTGSPMFEVLSYYRQGISDSSILEKLGLTKKKYFVISTHREENVDEEFRLKKIGQIINELCSRYQLPVILSVHPRTKKRIDVFNIQFDPLVQAMKPLGFLDYIKLQQNAFCVISDSGTISEESSILNFPALNLREVHERPEAMEKAVAIMTGLNFNLIMDAIPLATQSLVDGDKNMKLVDDYSDSTVSDKVVKIIMSYTDFINRRVWYKND